TQNFGYHKALDGVDVELYEGQITVLLGHNGAGKSTLMSILTGTLGASGGMAIVCGYDVVRQTSSARKSIGFCQQKDVFFSDLTVWEHLVYFGKLKGLREGQVSDQAAETLQAVELEEKGDTFPHELSGGMKRRLSIALAIVSNPKVVFLDEPTTGLDPENKRIVWDLLLRMRNKSTLLVSTHDMEEANNLADRIVVLADGRVLCNGSPTFLKRAYGVGYQLRIVKNPVRFNLARLMSAILEVAPKAEVEDRIQDVAISLNTLSHEGFATMFEKIEHDASVIGVDAIGVTVSTMAEVYIKINLDWMPNQDKRDAVVLNAKDVAFVGAMAGTHPHSCTRLKALFTKRALCFSRSFVPFLSALVLPVSIFILLFGGNRKEVFTKPFSESTTEVVLSLRDLYPEADTFAEHDSEARDFFLLYKPLLESEGAEVEVLKNATQHLLDVAKEDYVGYTQRYLLGGVFRGHRLEGWYNPFAGLSRMISLHLLDTAVLRLESGNQSAQIGTTISVNVDPLRSSLLSNRLRDLISSMGFILDILITLAQWAIYGPLLVGVLCASFALFPFVEKACRSRDLQLMTGISGPLYVLSNFLFDLAVYVVVFIVLMACFAYRYRLHGESYVAVAAVVLMHSGMGILWPYAVANAAGSQAVAYAIIMVTFTVAGPILLGVQLFARFFGLGKAAAWLFMALPPTSLVGAIIKVLKLDLENKECLKGSRILVGNETLLDKNCQLEALRESGYGYAHCCKSRVNPAGLDLLSPFSWDYGGIAFDMLAMLLEGTILFAFLSWMHSARFLPRFGSDRKSGKQEWDSDVLEEKNRVERLCVSKKFKECALVVNDVHKHYGTVHAVRGLSFVVAPKECFGLLGVNGAGKTTTFQVLTALEPITQGEGFMTDVRLSKNPRKWQSRIGYCLQSGGLLEKLDAYEHLRLFSHLRGVPKASVKKLVDSMVSIVDLEQHAKRRCGKYSGGNKRKLLLAIATIGLPRVVFLDEPSAGVDVVARRKIFTSLREIRSASQMSHILTSHSMDECELACDRIGIMVDGQLQCLGTLQHLKEKFGRGYTLMISLKDGQETDPAAVKSAVEEAFPGIRLRDQREHSLNFNMTNKLAWSELFTRIEAFEQRFKFAHAFVSDSTLEHIFVEFAQK
ncbi:unnamed protein product, partial [Ixodes pacificus]